ncbi:MAG: RecX family transcriptional regulator [Alphaproteobacteria bacterium]|nr:RecX family transcriptional regulator [Alphaproteobacteria bacterium]
MAHHKVDSMKNNPEKQCYGNKNNTAHNIKHNKKPKKITPTYLHNSGLYYLERFSASKFHFKEVMARKVKRSCIIHKDQDYNTCIKMVTDLADKFEACGLLNDEIYANALASSLRRKGLSYKAIEMRMRSKGVAPDIIITALNSFDFQSHETREDADFFAAITLARKKKIGPYFTGETQNLQKSLGIFARMGFSYNIAQRVLDISPNELDEIF